RSAIATTVHPNSPNSIQRISVRMWIVIAIGVWALMTTIQMTLEEELLTEMDRTVKRMGTTRSALIRESIRQYLKTLQMQQLEARHRAGYNKRKAGKEEFHVPESDRGWGE